MSKRIETRFIPDGDLITVITWVKGRNGRMPGRFVLDTGAAMTTIAPRMIRKLGYGTGDRLRSTKVRSALGEERGYTLRVESLSALHVRVRNLEVNVFDLGYDDYEGLLGMNFLNALFYDVRFAEQRLLVQPAIFDLDASRVRGTSPSAES
jgi:clan AA aspartic protease (TIGR02281 family)